MCLLQEIKRGKISCSSGLGRRVKFGSNLHEIGPNERVQIPGEDNQSGCQIQEEISFRRTGFDKRCFFK